MTVEVFPDPQIQDPAVWRVRINGRIASPTFSSKLAAQVFAMLVTCGRRQVEAQDPLLSWEPEAGKVH